MVPTIGFSLRVARAALWLAPLLFAGVAASARAQTCTSNADCPDRFTCEKVGTTACDSPKECPPGATCPTPAACEPMDIKECKSPACTKDSDCPTDMVCYAQTSTACSGGSAPACKPGASCPEPVDAGQPVCMTTTTHSCVPRYVPPCKQDADCGSGFSCTEQKLCSCSGGAARSPDGGVSMQADSCTCSSSGTSYCELQPKTCKAASDCPSGWTCEANPNGTACATIAGGAPVGKGAGDAGTSLDAGPAPDFGCPDAGPPSKMCLPRYYEVVEPRGSLGEASAATDKGSSTGTSNGGTMHAVLRKSHNVCAVVAPGGAHQHGASLVWWVLASALFARHSRRRQRA